MLRLGPALAAACAALLWAGAARAAEDGLCDADEEILGDPALLAAAGEAADAGDCAPIELLPDVSCEAAPSTFWPAAVNACDTPLLKVRRAGAHRGPRLVAPSGRRPLKGVAASDVGSFRACGGPATPLPDADLRLARDPALAVFHPAPGLAPTRLPYDRGDAAPLAAGHARRLERPPER